MQQEIQDRIVAWANETFPDRLPASGFLKMYEEIGEVVGDPTNTEEWADVFIMLLDLMNMFEIDIAQLKEAINRKMDVNESRTWHKTETGIYKHLREYPWQS